MDGTVLRPIENSCNFIRRLEKQLERFFADEKEREKYVTEEMLQVFSEVITYVDEMIEGAHKEIRENNKRIADVTKELAMVLLQQKKSVADVAGRTGLSEAEVKEIKGGLIG